MAHRPDGVGWLTVTTAPPGVGVVIDGVRVGETPLTVEQPPGDRFVVLQHNQRNHGPYTVTVAPGERMEAEFRLLDALERPNKVQAGARQRPFRVRKRGVFGRGALVRQAIRGAMGHSECFPAGWAGPDLPEPKWVPARLEFTATGRLSRVRIMHPSADLAMERCVEQQLGLRFDRRTAGGIANIKLTVKLRLERKRPRQ